MIRKKVENGVTSYSKPFSKFCMSWVQNRSYLKHGTDSEPDEMLAFYFTNDATGKKILDNNGGGFYWGLTDDKRIFNLTVDGVSPTEIIEHEMDGEKIYLWYFTNLNVDYQNLEKLDIKY